MRDVAVRAEDAKVIHVLGGRGAVAGVPQLAEAADALAVPWIWMGVLELALDRVLAKVDVERLTARERFSVRPGSRDVVHL